MSLSSRRSSGVCSGVRGTSIKTPGCGRGISPQCPGGSQVRSMKWFGVSAKDGVGCLTKGSFLLFHPIPKPWPSFSMLEGLTRHRDAEETNLLAFIAGPVGISLTRWIFGKG